MQERHITMNSAPQFNEMAEAYGNVVQKVTAIWQELFDGRQFEIDDDFFDCGGDSFLAVQLLIKLEQEFNIQLPLDGILTASTISKMAGLLLEGGSVTTQTAYGIVSGSKEIKYRFACFGDLRGIWHVCTRAFVTYDNASFKEFEELCRHRWLDNPFRTENDPFGWVLEDRAGQIVGFLGLVPMPVWIGGKSYLAIAPTTWAVEPGHHKAGLALLLTLMEWSTDRFLLNTTAAAITGKIHESSNLGMRKIPLRDFDQRLVWVLDFKALLQWKIAKCQLPSVIRSVVAARTGQAVIGRVAPLAFGLAGGVRAAIRASLGQSRIRFKATTLSVEMVDRFGPEFDALWDRLKRNYAVTIERTARLLNWRHLTPSTLLGKSYVFACRDGETLLGYAAVRESTTTFPGHLIVTDIFYDEARVDVFHALMNAVFRFAEAHRASALEVFGFHPSINAELRTQYPYILRRVQLERLGRGVSLSNLLSGLDPRIRGSASATYWYRAPCPELDRICTAGPWWPSGIDGDLNL